MIPTDQSRIDWVEKFEANVAPYRDEKANVEGWIAGCPSFVGWGRGSNWREAIDSLMELVAEEEERIRKMVRKIA